GIYAAGCVSTPLRISDSVAQAEAAATLAAEDRSRTIESPRMIELTGEPSVGVVIFTDRNDLGKYLDLEKIRSEIASIESVSGVEEAATLQELESKIGSLVTAGSNRIIVAGLSHRKHEEMVRDMAERAGLNRYLVEIANIREHAAWVHPRDEASAKSIDLIRMGIAKAKKLTPLNMASLPVTKKALVLGGGVAGMRASIEIASKGIGVYLIEREDKLGGMLGTSNEVVSDLIEQVESNDLIQVMTSCEVDRIDGFVGNFSCMVGDEKLEAGAIVIATGAERADPTGLYNYGEDPKVITNAELKPMLNSGLDAKAVAMIQCDASPASSIETVANALEIRKQNPQTEVFVLCEDVKTYGVYEKLYRDARSSGAIFLRYEPENPPKYENGIVSIFDTMIGDEVQIKPDLVVLGVGVEVGDRMEVINDLFGTDMPDKFYAEVKGDSHLRLKPVDFEIDGTFIAGAIKLPRTVDEAIAEGIAAASRVCSILQREDVLIQGAVALVNDEICSGCGVCVEACPFGAIELLRSVVEEHVTYGWPILEVKEVAHVTEICMGCGTCASLCPSSAITHQSFDDEGVLAQIEAII
ncbi:MAG: 4Fe-4S binding protein, partial [Candidatus Syntrophoarchaeum sp.]|nr:4Fe-4S binding protein [Candidatus Syntrophoarchaeum sp.]